ncbi:unnamed protein product [Closterium sp. Yama58-4]|nr:unnamed protein product [Closterium sp. Yama58-4]
MSWAPQTLPPSSPPPSPSPTQPAHQRAFLPSSSQEHQPPQRHISALFSRAAAKNTSRHNGYNVLGPSNPPPLFTPSIPFTLHNQHISALFSRAAAKNTSRHNGYNHISALFSRAAAKNTSRHNGYGPTGAAGRGGKGGGRGGGKGGSLSQLAQSLHPKGWNVRERKARRPVWHKALESTHLGRFSLAMYEANYIMEDTVEVQSSSRGVFIGIHDGHNGSEAAEFLRETLYNNIMSECTEGNGVSVEALRRGFDATERQLAAIVREAFEESPHLAMVGACSVAALITPTAIWVANVGDCRAVLGQVRQVSDGVECRAVQLSTDHNLSVPAIREKYIAEHADMPDAVVERRGRFRVKGKVMVTKAFGDLYLKSTDFNREPLVSRFRVPEPFNPPLISADPSVAVRVFSPHDSFVIVASDGLFEFLSNQEAVNIVASSPKKDVARQLIRTALQRAAEKTEMLYSDLLRMPSGQRRDYHDDISVVVFFLDHDAMRRSSHSFWKKDVSIKGGSAASSLLAAPTISGADVHNISSMRGATSARDALAVARAQQQGEASPHGSASWQAGSVSEALQWQGSATWQAGTGSEVLLKQSSGMWQAGLGEVGGEVLTQGSEWEAATQNSMGRGHAGEGSGFVRAGGSGSGRGGAWREEDRSMSGSRRYPDALAGLTVPEDAAVDWSAVSPSSSELGASPAKASGPMPVTIGHPVEPNGELVPPTGLSTNPSPSSESGSARSFKPVRTKEPRKSSSAAASSSRASRASQPGSLRVPKSPRSNTSSSSPDQPTTTNAVDQSGTREQSARSGGAQSGGSTRRSRHKANSSADSLSSASAVTTASDDGASDAAELAAAPAEPPSTAASSAPSATAPSRKNAAARKERAAEREGDEEGGNGGEGEDVGAGEREGGGEEEEDEDEAPALQRVHRSTTAPHYERVKGAAAADEPRPMRVSTSYDARGKRGLLLSPNTHRVVSFASDVKLPEGFDGEDAEAFSRNSTGGLMGYQQVGGLPRPLSAPSLIAQLNSMLTPSRSVGSFAESVGASGIAVYVGPKMQLFRVTRALLMKIPFFRKQLETTAPDGKLQTPEEASEDEEVSFMLDCDEATFSRVLTVVQYHSLEALPWMNDEDFFRLRSELDFLGITLPPGSPWHHLPWKDERKAAAASAAAAAAAAASGILNPAAAALAAGYTSSSDTEEIREVRGGAAAAEGGMAGGMAGGIGGGMAGGLAGMMGAMVGGGMGVGGGVGGMGGAVAGAGAGMGGMGGAGMGGKGFGTGRASLISARSMVRRSVVVGGAGHETPPGVGGGAGGAGGAGGGGKASLVEEDRLDVVYRHGSDTAAACTCHGTKGADGHSHWVVSLFHGHVFCAFCGRSPAWHPKLFADVFLLTALPPAPTQRGANAFVGGWYYHGRSSTRLVKLHCVVGASCTACRASIWGVSIEHKHAFCLQCKATPTKPAIIAKLFVEALCQPK